ncbi:MAG: GAF domain-containing protein [Candidatus Bipolaricaulota bacterium]
MAGDEFFGRASARRLGTREEHQPGADQERYIGLLGSLSRLALAEPDPEGVLEVLAESLAEFFAADGCCISLWDQARGTAVPQASWGELGGDCGHPDLAEAVLQAGQPCSLEDVGECEEGLSVRSILGLPLLSGGGWLGTAILGFRWVREFHSEELRRAGHLAAQVSLAISRALLLTEARGRSRELEALHQASLHLTASLNLSQVLSAILEQAQRLMAARETHVHLWDGERLTWGTARAPGKWLENEGWRLQALSYAVARTGERAVIPDLRADPRCSGWGWDGAVAGLPLKVGERVVGVMNLVWADPHAVTDEELRVLELLADQAALAVENARLFGEVSRGLAKLKRTLEGVIDAVVATVEARDPFTAGHQRRVSQLACAVARELGLGEEEVEGIRVAGLVHDLGKVSVPAEILNKPGRLGRLEFELIKRHPQVGCNILKGIEFPGSVGEIVLQHHERLDGSGYPNGICGEDMLLGAKILAVADVVEAIASDRPYRPGSGTEKALEHVVRCRGELYDPEVVDACLCLFTERRFHFAQE